MESINDILASLTPDDIKALKDTADALFGSAHMDSGTSAKERQQPPENGNASAFGGFDFGGIDPEMFTRLGGIMSAMNSDGGQRCRLIEALKPNLSPGRQKKADEAIQILKLLELMPMMNEFMKRDDKNSTK